MSRPFKRESEMLERLEGVSALHHKAQESAGLLDIRLRQIHRRAPGVGEYVTLAGEELARLADCVDDAQSLIAAELEAQQEHRRGSDDC